MCHIIMYTINMYYTSLTTHLLSLYRLILALSLWSFKLSSIFLPHPLSVKIYKLYIIKILLFAYKHTYNYAYDKHVL